MQKISGWSSQYVNKIRYLLIVVGGYLLACILSPLWVKNVYVVHTGFELTCILISLSTFLLVWNIYEKTSAVTQIISFGFFAVAIFDVLHIYYFFGIRSINHGYFDLSTRYWIIGRLTEAIILYIASLGNTTKMPNKSLLFIGVVCWTLALSVIGFFYPTRLPGLLNNGGLTVTEDLLEYFVICIALLSIYNFRNKVQVDDGAIAYREIYIALCLIISVGLLSTLLTMVTSIYCTYGHILRIAYYYYLYKAVFVSAITYPYYKLDVERNLLEQKSRELEMLTEELNERQLIEQQTREKIAQLDRLHLVGEMAASIGHEVRNPMTTVKGYLQLFRRKDNFFEYRDDLNVMIEELDRANEIITEFLSLAKNKAIKLKRGNINGVITALYPLIQADALRLGHDICLHLTHIPESEFDENEIRQLILNLVRNGLEAMEKSGVITIGTRQDNNNEIVVTICDTGTGIPKEILARIGTPFLTTKETGTGLGLPVCYRIAEKHGAKINFVTSSAGTIFMIRFPTKPILCSQAMEADLGKEQSGQPGYVINNHSVVSK